MNVVVTALATSAGVTTDFGMVNSCALCLILIGLALLAVAAVFLFRTPLPASIYHRQTQRLEKL